MNPRYWTVLAALLMVSACSSGPTYHGRESSTAGMPGVINGQKIHPTVKLGKPYTVAGKTYVPRYEPEYEEEGLASWYGPGFHGGRTANGEQFSTHDYTAAHTTLPMPSIVRVTHLGNGKQVYVRINDRGPFAHKRIIDLSKAAAEEIDLIRDGVAKVRVEYMPAESQKFAEMLAQGRSPGSIDIASEVIGNTEYADSTPTDAIIVADTTPPAGGSTSWWNPISSAEAAEPGAPLPAAVTQPQPAAIVVGNDVQNPALPPASLPQQQPVVITPEHAAAIVTTTPAMLVPPPAAPASPFDAMSISSTGPPPEQAPAPVVVEPIAQNPPAMDAPAAGPIAITQPVRTKLVTPPGTPGTYVQLGAFSVESNAAAMQSRFSDLATTQIVSSDMGGVTLYRVRMGPFVSREAAEEMLARTQSLGITDAKIVIQP